MGNESDIETSLMSLDEALSSWDLWKRVKHYIRTWNLAAKVLNEYGELIQGILVCLPVISLMFSLNFFLLLS